MRLGDLVSDYADAQQAHPQDVYEYFVQAAEDLFPDIDDIWTHELGEDQAGSITQLVSASRSLYESAGESP